MKSTLEINTDRNEVFVSGKRVHLAPKEYKILLALRDSKKTMSRKDLLKVVWEHARSINIDTRTVDQHVARLRRKIKIPCVETVSCFGYRIAAI